MRLTILSQRDERDRLLAKSYQTRRVGSDLEVMLHSPLIKLITGPRRAGKSTQALLMLRGRNFAYLNFDDNNLLKKWDEDLVMRALQDVYPGYEYLLLDEVQNLEGWDLWVSKLYRNGMNLVITGSNARMLSSEMSTALTGRYLEIKMMPFSLDEFYEWNHIDIHRIAAEDVTKASILKDEYLRLGGYPESVGARSITQSYLSTLFDSIIWKDVARRHKVRSVTEINNVALYLLSNFCNPLSATGLAEDLGMSSVNTVKKFMAYLAEPYLFFYLPRYNNKLKLMKKAPHKIYVVDNGFVEARGYNLSDNLGRLLENQVFMELLRRGFSPEMSTVFYYRSRNNKETDFVLRENNQVVQLVQVCYDISASRTLKREIDAIIECAEELKCEDLVIVTYNEERTMVEKGHTIKIIPIEKF